MVLFTRGMVPPLAESAGVFSRRARCMTAAARSRPHVALLHGHRHERNPQRETIKSDRHSLAVEVDFAGEGVDLGGQRVGVGLALGGLVVMDSGDLGAQLG